MESVAGDGGTHSAVGAWWLSSDIKLTSASSVSDSADFNVNNPIDVTAHLKSGVALPAGTNNIIVDLYVGNPSLSMSPGVNTKLVGQALLPVASFAGGKETKTLQFKPTGSGTDADAPGHRCMIARCYSELLSPDVAAFHLPDDQHYVQHNITVASAPAGGQMHMNVNTGNPSRAANQHITVLVAPELRPSRQLLAFATQQAKTVRGFTTFTATAPQAIHLDVANFRAGALALSPAVAFTPIAATTAAKLATPAKTAAKVTVAKATPAASRFQLLSASTDFFRLGANFATLAQKTAPSLQLQLQLKPNFFSNFVFTADLSHAKKGEATIYNLTQHGEDGRAHGGLTVVVVAT